MSLDNPALPNTAPAGNTTTQAPGSDNPKTISADEYRQLQQWFKGISLQTEVRHKQTILKLWIAGLVVLGVVLGFGYWYVRMKTGQLENTANDSAKKVSESAELAKKNDEAAKKIQADFTNFDIKLQAATKAADEAKAAAEAAKLTEVGVLRTEVDVLRKDLNELMDLLKNETSLKGAKDIARIKGRAPAAPTPAPKTTP